MKYLVRDGVKLYYDIDGKGSPPIVFVHGWTCNHTYFAPQQKYFGKRHRVVSVDLRGHGKSDKPEQQYSIAGFADDLAWMCAELGLKKPVVVGHSMGGMVALELAASHPDVPGAIVTCDSPVVVPAQLATNMGATLEQFRKRNWRPAHRAFIADALFIPTDDAKRKERILKDMTSAPDHVTIGCFEAIAAADTEGAARKCKVPFLNILAASPLCDVERLRELCPAAVVGQTVGAGHFHQLEVPDQVNGMIERFLRLSNLK
jgi:pimeloyl-ACP methyl ester carboxylesterase